MTVFTDKKANIQIHRAITPGDIERYLKEKDNVDKLIYILGRNKDELKRILND